jgi:hypothetical protein
MADSPARLEAESAGQGVIGLAVAPESLYEVECVREGRRVWTETFHNVVTTVGRNKLLVACFKTGGMAANAWFVGLVNNASFTAFALADTMASHAWLESTAYSNAARPPYVPGVIAAAAVSNAIVRAVFTINAVATLRGAFLADTATKGGTLGILYGGGSFVAPRSVVVGDILNVTITLGMG